MAGGGLRTLEGGRGRGTLAGREVAFAGRFATISRDEAAELAAEAGARPVARAGDGTALLVVGDEGWPVRDDGRLAENLERAHRLREAGRTIEVIPERDFLERLGLSEPGASPRLYTGTQLARILKLPRRRIRAWIRRGLIRPARTERRVDWFDFRQVAEVKRLAELTANGVAVDTIRGSLAELARWFPETESAIARLESLEGEDGLLVRLGRGRLAEPSGQLRLLFDEGAPDEPPAEASPLPAPPPDPGRPVLGVIQGGAPAAAPAALSAADAPGPDRWFELALEFEEAERLEDAARAYREALLAGGPSAEIAFNLGNVLHSLGRWEEALSRFEQSVEIDPEYAEAWNNLASVHAQFEEWDEAIAAGERALALAADYADAHYNLAEAYHAAGRKDAARRHARAYLETDPQSPWARRLRENLGLS